MTTDRINPEQVKLWGYSAFSKQRLMLRHLTQLQITLFDETKGVHVRQHLITRRSWLTADDQTQVDF